MDMPKTRDSTTIEMPTVLRDRLQSMKRHERQAYYEVVEAALDFYEDHVVPRGNPLVATV